MLLCPSIEELKNVWLPFSIRMKMTKNKGLDVCNWTDGDDMQVVEKLGVRRVRDRNEGSEVGQKVKQNGKWWHSVREEEGKKARNYICELFQSSSFSNGSQIERR